MLNLIKSFVSSGKTTIILIVVSLLLGFYLGWHLNNERHVVGVLETIEEVRKLETNNIKSSIISSENTYNKINLENERAESFFAAYKQETDIDVLLLKLPDATLRVLYDASSRKTNPNSASGNNGQSGTR